jgi:predicted nucleotidyltransferase
MDYDQIARVLRALETHGVQYAIFGGVALNFHGIARFTEDLDLFLEPVIWKSNGFRSRTSRSPSSRPVRFAG